MYEKIRQLQEAEDRVQVKVIGLEQSQQTQVNRFNQEQYAIAQEQTRLDNLEKSILAQEGNGQQLPVQRQRNKSAGTLQSRKLNKSINSNK